KTRRFDHCQQGRSEGANSVGSQEGIPLRYAGARCTECGVIRISKNRSAKMISVGRSAISLAISSFVFPSVVIPRDLDATMSGSTADGVDCGADVEGGV